VTPNSNHAGPRWVTLAVLPLVLVLGVAGCSHSPVSSQSPPNGGTPTPAQTASPSPSSSPGQAPTPTGSPAAGSPSVAPCTATELGVTFTSAGAAAGHGGVRLHFTDLSTRTCTLYGYPGVAAIDGAGKQVLQATRTPNGYMGGLPAGTGTVPLVQLAPDQAATAILEWSNVPQGNQTSCPSYAGFLVTPPNTTRSTTLRPASGGLSLCPTLEIHPVLAGSTGESG
jgi:hypothetical protein